VSKLGWLLALAGAVLAALLGRETYHQRRLSNERERAKEAERAALLAKNAAAFAEARAEVERIDHELAVVRQSSVVDRVAAAVAEARERRGR
jgi:hypothetical protein